MGKHVGERIGIGTRSDSERGYMQNLVNIEKRRDGGEGYAGVVVKDCDLRQELF